MENEQARNMFDRIARRYDLLNHVLSLGVDIRWRKRQVKAVAEDSPQRILDVATGTADVAIALKRKLPKAQVTGVDLSEGMLNIGRDKAAKRNLDISLIKGNGEALEFETGSFDAVAIAFGIRNFADKEAGLREFARVLRSGGKAYILEFSTPRRGFFAVIYRFYFHKILPTLGRWISRDSRGAYGYLPASVDTFPEPQQFLALMHEAGFSDCRARKLTFGIAYIYTGTAKL